MNNINSSRKLLLERLKEISPLIFYDSEEYMMLYHYSLAVATQKVLDIYNELGKLENQQTKRKRMAELKLAIENEYAFNKEIKWQSLALYVNSLKQYQESEIIIALHFWISYL